MPGGFGFTLRCWRSCTDWHRTFGILSGLVTIYTIQALKVAIQSVFPVYVQPVRTGNKVTRAGKPLHVKPVLTGHVS